MVRVLIALIHCYQRFISPLKPQCCRYLPTCSEFAREAVERHGAWRGGLLSLRRLCSCHPLGGHGLDPVPETCTFLGGRIRSQRDRALGCAPAQHCTHGGDCHQ